MRAEISEVETKKTTEKISETNGWFSKKTNKLINLQPDSSREKKGKWLK